MKIAENARKINAPKNALIPTLAVLLLLKNFVKIWE